MIMIFLPALAGLLGRCVRSGRLLDGTPGLKTGLDGGQDFADGGAIPHADAGAAHLFKLGGKGVEDIPKVNVGNIGVSTRRARHHRQKKKAVETPQDPQS